MNSLRTKVLEMISIIKSNWLIKLIIFNIIFVSVMIFLEKITLSEIILRTIKIYMYFFIIFVIIFVPRRFLIRNKNYRYICLLMYKYYPEIHYIRMVLSGGSYNIMFLLNEYIRYYIKRIVHLLFIGTLQQDIWPYYKNFKNGNFILIVVMEIGSMIVYLYVYILKVFYEIIYSYDRKPLKEIIKLRIIGYLLIIGWYYIIGQNGFLIYLLILIVISVINRVGTIYKAYLVKIHELSQANISTNKLEQLSNAIILHGFDFKITYLHMQMDAIKVKTILLDGAIIKVKKTRIDKKYPYRLLPGYIGSGKMYNTKTKRYCFHESQIRDEETKYKNRHRNKSLIRVRYLNKGIEKFKKKQEYMDYETQEEFNAENIDRYNTALMVLTKYENLINEHTTNLIDLLDVNKCKYYMVNRRVELGLKFGMLSILISIETFDDEDYEYYIDEIMSNLGGSFIELKQFSKIAKKFKTIVTKEGGRANIINVHYIYLAEIEKKNPELVVIYIVKLIDEGEKKYDG